MFTGTLFARSFDVDELKVTGPEVEVLDDVYFDGDYEGSSCYSISETGKLVYARGLPADRLVFLVDLEGKAERLRASPQLYGEARFSPEGDSIALVAHAHPDRIDLYELEHDRQSFLLSHVTDEEGSVWEYERGVEWHPEGRLVTIHARNPHSALRALLVSIDGSVDPELPLLGRTARAHGWTPDGSLLFTEITTAETRQDIWVLTLDKSPSTKELAGGPGFQGQPAVSRDGRWLAYTSDHSGQAEVWATAYGGSGHPVQVSIDGGQDPLWAPDGKVIYFRDGEHVMAVDILTEPELSAGTPRALFEDPYFILTWVIPRTFDLSPAGDQFVMIQEGERWGTRLEVVNNWFEELKRLVPKGQ
jgi:serine/threonine-protein kinase